MQEVVAEDGFGEAVQDEDEAAVGVAIPEDGVEVDGIAAEEEAERGEFLVGGEQFILCSAGMEVIGEQNVRTLRFGEAADGRDERGLEERQVEFTGFHGVEAGKLSVINLC
ncbi:MAG: hypothetical protein K0Q55_1623 [Verrucomicrobia bacterium]|nr:hypothetical protein [Verrucomicrobiota bacterium]